MWYGTFANPMIPCWNVWKRSQWTHRAIFTRSLYTFGNIISPVPILASLFSFSFVPVNGLTWYGLKNTIYKVELKSTLSELLKAEAKQNYILLSLYSLLSSAVFLKKIVKPKSASLLHHSNISFPLVYYLFLNCFPPLVSSSVSWRSWTAQNSEQVQPYWSDSKETLKDFYLHASSLTSSRAQIASSYVLSHIHI